MTDAPDCNTASRDVQYNEQTASKSSPMLDDRDRLAKAYVDDASFTGDERRGEIPLNAWEKSVGIEAFKAGWGARDEEVARLSEQPRDALKLNQERTRCLDLEMKANKRLRDALEMAKNQLWHNYDFLCSRSHNDQAKHSMDVWERVNETLSLKATTGE